MTVFGYEAARLDGRAVRGRLEAASGADAAAQVSAAGLFPLVVRPVRRSSWAVRPRVRTSERALLLRSLASLLEAKVPLKQALDASAEIVGGALVEPLKRVAARVADGASLAAGLDEEQLLPRVAIGLIRAGERGVGLETGLAEAARVLDREQEIRGKLQAAIAYPALLLLAGGLSVAFILLVVVPRFEPLLTDVRGALPLTTELMLAVSRALSSHAPLLLASLIAAAAGGVAFMRSRREVLPRVLLGLPFTGTVRHALATARTCRALGALLRSGMSALPALDVVIRAAGDPEIALRLGTARRTVEEGRMLSRSLSEAQALTAPALKLVAIGERSGRLGDLLFSAAEMEEARAERLIRRAVALLEPGLIVAFAVVVAFVAAALLQAVYSVRP